MVNIEGEEQVRTLKAITESNFTFAEGNLSAKELSQLRFNDDGKGSTIARISPAMLYLRNGDVIAAQIISGDDSKLTFSNEALGKVTLDNKFIDGILFTQKEKPSTDMVDAFMKSALTEDQLLMPNGDTAKGALEKISDKDLNFNVEKQSKPYTFEQALGVRLVPLDEYKAPAEFRATIQLSDGSHLTAKLKGLTDDAVQFDGIDDKPWTAAVGSIKSFVFKGGSLLYLSELTPKNVEEKPYAGGGVPVGLPLAPRPVDGRPADLAGWENVRQGHRHAQLLPADLRPWRPVRKIPGAGRHGRGRSADRRVRVEGLDRRQRSGVRRRARD